MVASLKNISLTDLAGFWAMVFCGFGLLMLSIAEAKIERRFSRLEARDRYFSSSQPITSRSLGDLTGRETSAQAAATPLPKYSLLPIRLLLAVGTAAGVVLVARWSWQQACSAASKR